MLLQADDASEASNEDEGWLEADETLPGGFGARGRCSGTELLLSPFLRVGLSHLAMPPVLQQCSVELLTPFAQKNSVQPPLRCDEPVPARNEPGPGNSGASRERCRGTPTAFGGHTGGKAKVNEALARIVHGQVASLDSLVQQFMRHQAQAPRGKPLAKGRVELMIKEMASKIKRDQDEKKVWLVHEADSLGLPEPPPAIRGY